MPRYYAWSRILLEPERDPNDRNVVLKQRYVMPGEQVDAAKLGLTESQFQELVDSSAVREMRYPDIPKGYTGSPIDWFREQAKQAAQYGEASIAMLTTLAPLDPAFDFDSVEDEELGEVDPESVSKPVGPTTSSKPTTPTGQK
jgi:hypothetical protein